MQEPPIIVRFVQRHLLRVPLTILRSRRRETVNSNLSLPASPTSMICCRGLLGVCPCLLPLLPMLPLYAKKYQSCCFASSKIRKLWPLEAEWLDYNTTDFGSQSAPFSCHSFISGGLFPLRLIVPLSRGNRSFMHLFIWCLVFNMIKTTHF